MAYPALHIQPNNVGSSFLNGQQVGQDIRQRNMLMEQQQAKIQRDEQFRNLLAQSVGPMAAAAAQPPDETGANYLMQATQNPFAGPPPEAMNQLLALDPERAMAMAQMFEAQQQQQQAQQREEAATRVRSAQFVLRSKDPKRTLEIGFPDVIENLRENGVDFDSLDDEGVRELANRVIEQLAPIAGIGPAQGESPFAKVNPSEYTPDSVAKFESSGNFGDLVALEKPGDDPNDKLFTRATQLRKEFASIDDNFQTIRGAYENIQGAANDEAGDTLLMTNFMRLIAPGIRVQPGQELDSKSLPSGLQAGAAIWNKFVNDGQLGTKERANIRSQAKTTYETQKRLAKEARTRFTRLATEAGLDPWQVVGDDSPASGGGGGGGGGGNAGGELSFGSEAEAEAAGVKPGTRVIINGVKGTWQ